MQDLAKVNEIIQNYAEQRTPIIYILKDVQKEYGCLSDVVLTEVAKKVDIPLSQLYGVATFYSLFTTTAKGTYVIRCCNNASCHVNNSKEVLNAIQKYLDLKMNETTPCGTFTLELTSCLGLCAVAPVMMVNDEVYGNLTPEKAVAILKDYKMKGQANA